MGRDSLRADYSEIVGESQQILRLVLIRKV